MRNKVNVILYCRVCDKTTTEGLEVQKNKLINFCAKHNYHVVEIVQSSTGITHKNDEKLLDCLRRNKGKADKILCVSWDRLIRCLETSCELIKELVSTGIEPVIISKRDSFGLEFEKYIYDYYLSKLAA